ncbi:hypothetical protein A0Y59_08245, partial [Campylobacter lari]|nr:hypothetical protein [Campylobacter lari]
MINSTQEKNSNSTIKQTFLSLATISFLATCANASITTISDKVSNGSIVISKAKTTTNSTTKIKNSRSITGGGTCSGTTCTISNTINQTVTIGNGGGTLTIESGGTINANSGHGIAVNNNANNVTINNAGSIQGGSGNGNNAININSSTINNITNSGIISGNKQNAIMVENKSTIENLINSGSILGNDPSKGGAIVVKNQGTTIKNLENSGTIIASVDGISVHTQGTVNTIINSGVIQGGKNGILVNHANSTVDTIINKGTIISTGTNPTSYQNVAGGIQVQWDAKVKTIDNQGTILTNSSGVALMGNSGQGTNIETLKNSGTIKYDGDKTINTTYEENGQGAGIYVVNLNGIPKIGTIDNSGLMDVYNGMYFVLGSQVGTISNSGTILASKDGIVLGNDEASKEELQTRVDYINNTGTIQAGRYGIFIDVAANDKVPFQIGKINIDGVVSGGVAGFYIGANQKLTEDIIVKGTLTGGSAGIINNGVIGESGSSKGGIKLQDGGLILASNTMYGADAINPAILNTGNGIIYGNTELDSKSKIIGGVVNAGNAKLIGDIIVKGGSSISGGIINTDSGVVTGSIKVQGSDSAIEGGIINDGDGKLQGSIEVSGGGKLDSIVNQGNGQITGDVSVGSGSSVDNITNSG